ncbi:MAG: GGDEF domain-containing protein [Candidatus Dormibacteria bacterium]
MPTSQNSSPLLPSTNHISPTPLPEDELSVPSTEVVGWALHALTKGHEHRTDFELRGVLAAALHVDASVLALFDRTALEHAVDAIRSLVLRNQLLTAEATIDELTQSLRRGAGLAALQRELKRFQRNGGRGVVVVFIDVDGLKAVNDTIGHSAGDELLQTVVQSVSTHLRSYDIIFRYGGDEFVCALTEATLADARKRIHSIQEHVREHTGGNTVSFGLAVAQRNDSLETLLARADADLYRKRRLLRGKSQSSKTTAED